MTAEAAVFEADSGAPHGAPEDSLRLDLDGYEGPIDVLLTLARDQKVDLKKISILELADQYLAFVARARRLRLVRRRRDLLRSNRRRLAEGGRRERHARAGIGNDLSVGLNREDLQQQGQHRRERGEPEPRAARRGANGAHRRPALRPTHRIHAHLPASNVIIYHASVLAIVWRAGPLITF